MANYNRNDPDTLESLKRLQQEIEHLATHKASRHELDLFARALSSLNSQVRTLGSTVNELIARYNLVHAALQSETTEDLRTAMDALNARLDKLQTQP